MPSILKFTPAMFAEVHERLLRALDPRMSEDHWRHVFLDRGWGADQPLGYVMAHEGKLVGVLGTLFSERTIRGKSMPLCNLHSWYVEPEHRAMSLLLMRPVLALKDHTLTDFSPANHVVTISRRLGFETLDGSICIMPRLPWIRHQKLQITDLSANAAIAERELNAVDLCIYQDHQQLDCRHLLIHGEGSYCYLVCSPIESHWPRHCAIYYVSNLPLFVEHNTALRKHLLGSGERYAAIYTRLLAGHRVPCSVSLRAWGQLFRSNTLSAREVDPLYSELVLFKQPMRPQLRSRIKATLKRFVPSRWAAS